MSSEHVIAILGFAGKDIGDGAIIHEYANENGEIVFISYEIDSVGALVVSRIYNGADTSM